MDTVNARMAYEMHLAGEDEFTIAEKLRITVDEAVALFTEFSASMPTPTTTEARRDEVKRVDTWLARVDAAWISKEITVPQAVLSFCRLSERRCRLLGLEAPTKAEIEATLHAATPASIEEEIARLALDLGL